MFRKAFSVSSGLIKGSRGFSSVSPVTWSQEEIDLINSCQGLVNKFAGEVDAATKAAGKINKKATPDVMAQCTEIKQNSKFLWEAYSDASVPDSHLKLLMHDCAFSSIIFKGGVPQAALVAAVRASIDIKVGECLAAVGSLFLLQKYAKNQPALLHTDSYDVERRIRLFLNSLKMGKPLLVDPDDKELEDLAKTIHANGHHLKLIHGSDNGVADQIAAFGRWKLPREIITAPIITASLFTNVKVIDFSQNLNSQDLKFVLSRF